jgi:predicted phage replisome organizer
MADVKWIKITTDIFDDEKMLLIESLPDAHAIIVVWFKLLCLAGKMNNSGVFMMNDKIAYTDKMLSTIFRMKESTVQLALQTFEQFGMIEMIDGVITIPNWGKHQNLDQLEEKKKYMKEYMRNYREKQKSISCKTNNKTNSKANVSFLEEEREEEEKEREEEKIRYREIVNLYHACCPSYPVIKSLSDARKKAIKARLKTYSMDDFRTLFEKAEASSFLKGGNDRNWTATFDWMLKDSNMAKIIDGNYDNRSGSPKSVSGYRKQTKAEELDESYAMMAKWADS